MRWLFPDLNNPDEAAQVRQTMQAVQQWWQAFSAKAGDIERVFKRKTEFDLPRFMEDSLQAIHPSLMWEFGPAVRIKGHRLVITPETQRWLRPLVRTILHRAPKLEGWEFYAYRLPEDVEQTALGVKGRVGLNIDGATLAASVAPGRKIDLAYSFPRLARKSEDEQMQAAFVTTEVLLGEQVLDTWIGSIGLQGSDDESGSRPLSLDRAQATVSALIQGIYEQLPASRSQDVGGGDNWMSIKLEPPEEADDYPDRSDLLIAITHNVELFQAIHGGYPFASACHSKVNEIFCYLKLDARGVSPNELVAFRGRFETALNQALLKADFGCCIGGGTGLRYSYIDLALTDLARGVPLVREVLSQLQAPLRSWLLFHDDDLAAEWVGIHPQSPAPPSEEENE